MQSSVNNSVNPFLPSNSAQQQEVKQVNNAVNKVTIPRKRKAVKKVVKRAPARKKALKLPNTITPGLETLMMGEDEEVIDLEYIIKNKPKPKIVKEFMKELLTTIVSEEQRLFDK